MKQLLKIAKKITLLVLAISFFGCTNDDDNKYPVLEAGFTYTINIDTGTVTFINISSQATNYSWDFGDGTSSNLINPEKTYPPGEYKVILKATNVAGASDTFEDIIVISDVGAPIITLLGDTTINIIVGGTFTDPGATATDEEDGDITANIVVGGDTVDVNTAGTYIITYNVSDAAGNAATQRTRTVIVSEEVIEPCTAETAESLNAADFNLTFKTDQTANITADNATFAWISNPDFDNAVNPSCKVAEYVRNPDELYPNHQINFTNPLSFTNNAGFKLKVWSPTVGTNVTVKLEGATVLEVSKTTTVANAWEELTFEFGENASGNTKIVLFFNVGTNTPGTFYYDDFKLYPRDGGGGVCTAETAESNNAADFNLTFQTDQTANITADNATFAWISNPDFDNAVNPSCKIGEYVRNPNELYPNHQINFTTPLSFANNAGFKLKVWTPTVGTNVTVKLEGATVLEVSKATTVANAWEELTFDFGDNASGNTKIVLFFNVGTNTPGTFYYDDFKLYPRDGGGNPPGDCPAPPAGELLSNGDFEAGESCWQFFAGTSISTTVSNGGTNSAEMQGATGVAVNFKQERFAIGVVQPNTSYTVSFDIIANGPFGDGGVFKAFAFSEGADGGSVPATLHTLTDNTTSLATTWEKKTYTFTTAPNANQVEGGLSFLLEIVNSTAKLNVDNVVIKKTP
jgi:hypothetical protein